MSIFLNEAYIFLRLGLTQLKLERGEDQKWIVYLKKGNLFLCDRDHWSLMG